MYIKYYILLSVPFILCGCNSQHNIETEHNDKKQALALYLQQKSDRYSIDNQHIPWERGNNNANRMKTRN